jgi:hypothetical protein
LAASVNVLAVNSIALANARRDFGDAQNKRGAGISSSTPQKRLGLTTTDGRGISSADSATGGDRSSRRPADHTSRGGAISGADSGSRRPADHTSHGAISGVSNRLFRREREPGCRPGSWLTPVRRRLMPVCKHRTLQTAPRRILRIFSWGILLSTHRKHTPFRRSWLLTL